MTTEDFNKILIDFSKSLIKHKSDAHIIVNTYLWRLITKNSNKLCVYDTFAYYDNIKFSCSRYLSSTQILVKKYGESEYKIINIEYENFCKHSNDRS